MKKIAKMSLGLFVLVILLGSCEDRLTPSGYVTTQEREITNFDGLDVSTAFKVNVMFTSGDERVEIEADDNLQPYIIVENAGSTLRIRIQNSINISGRATLKAHIYTPEPLKYIEASGATHIRLENRLETDELYVDLEGASSLEGQVSVTDLDVILSGVSSIILEDGSAAKFNGDVDGASIVDAFNLECTELNLNISGASNAKVTVNGTIDLDASGSSVLVYRGHPTLTHINLSGSSRLVDGN